MRILASAAIVSMFALPVLAESHSMGDAAAGEKTFGKCKSCHMIVDASDEVIQKGGKTGPNLFGVVGRTAGTVEDFRYGDDLVAAGEAGLVWDEETLTEYVADPRTFLRTYLDDPKAKSKMSYKLKKGAEDVAAYLATFSPEDAGTTTESN